MDVQKAMDSYMSWLSSLPLLVAQEFFLLHLLMFALFLWPTEIVLNSFVAMFSGSDSISTELRAKTPRHPRPKTSYLARAKRTRLTADNRATVLKHRLLKLLDGDISVLNTLLERAKRSKPGMTEEWYLKKVIRALERRQRSRLD